MIGRRSVLRGVLKAAMGAVLLVPATEALAQPRNAAANRLHAGHGWANRNTWGHRQASRRMGHAIEYSRDLRGYAAYPRTVQPQERVVVPVAPYPVIVTEEIGRNISAAQRDIARVKKAADPKDAETKASLEKVEKHLVAAAEQHSKMEECCSGPECDGEMLAGCCEAAEKELEAAKAENDKLIKKLDADAAHEQQEAKPAAKE